MQWIRPPTDLTKVTPSFGKEIYFFWVINLFVYRMIKYVIRFQGVNGTFGTMVWHQITHLIFFIYNLIECYKLWQGNLHYLAIKLWQAQGQTRLHFFRAPEKCRNLINLSDDFVFKCDIYTYFNVFKSI